MAELIAQVKLKVFDANRALPYSYVTGGRLIREMGLPPLLLAQTEKARRAPSASASFFYLLRPALFKDTLEELFYLMEKASARVNIAVFSLRLKFSVRRVAR